MTGEKGKGGVKTTGATVVLFRRLARGQRRRRRRRRLRLREDDVTAEAAAKGERISWTTENRVYVIPRRFDSRRPFGVLRFFLPTDLRSVAGPSARPFEKPLGTFTQSSVDVVYFTTAVVRINNVTRTLSAVVSIAICPSSHDVSVALLHNLNFFASFFLLYI